MLESIIIIFAFDQFSGRCDEAYGTHGFLQNASHELFMNESQPSHSSLVSVNMLSDLQRDYYLQSTDDSLSKSSEELGVQAEIDVYI